MGTKEELPSEQLINRNLTSLIAVIFLFYGGLGCLYSTLVPHLKHIGFHSSEICTILTTVALISIIGPLLIGPIIDRISDRRKATYGILLQRTIAILLILGAIAYGLLLVVPSVSRKPPLNNQVPLVTFGCNQNGSVIFQQRCSEQSCFHWKKEKEGSLTVTNCTYTCQKPSQYENFYKPWMKNPVQSIAESSREKPDDDLPDYDGIGPDSGINRNRPKREGGEPPVEPPHLCSTTVDENGVKHVTNCHVYTSDYKHISFRGKLKSATNVENDTRSVEWCTYPIDGFTCNIPLPLAKYMQDHWTGDSECKPMVECAVYDPYGSNSALAESQCYRIDGDIQVTFWSYLVIRSIADIFPVAIITALNTAIIIATRETSAGRADIGRQLAWGALGWAIFPVILAAIGIHGELLVPVILCIVLWLIAAVILLVTKHMPLSPPEWWWHTKIGMLAIPLSAIRKYGPEIAALTIVAIILGAFWSIIETYQPLHLINLTTDDEPKLIIKLALTVAAIPAIFILWNVEVIVDYCGHANILIAAFAFYIVRYTGLALMDRPFYALFTSSLESITLVLVITTLILYMRHLVPRRLLGTGQAVPVIAILCIGKAIGTIIILFYDDDSVKLFREMAILAAIVGTSYFLLYHCYIVRKCQAARQAPPSPAELQSHANGGTGAGQNGTASVAPGNNYTPLRIYHNGRGRKGHFRY